MIHRRGARVRVIREPEGWCGPSVLGASGTVERDFLAVNETRGRVLVRVVQGERDVLVPCAVDDLEDEDRRDEDLDGIVLAIAREVAPRCRPALHALELLDEHARGDESVTHQLGIRWPREVAAGGAMANTNAADEKAYGPPGGDIVAEWWADRSLGLPARVSIGSRLLMARQINEAVQKAVEEEREACAKLAQETLWKREQKSQEMWAEFNQPTEEHVRARMRCHARAEEAGLGATAVGAAIRSRGKEASRG